MNYVGLDLGQRMDHSALVIASRGRGAQWLNGQGSGPLVVRYAERAPLGTPYPAVVEWVRAIVAQPEMQGRCSLAVDATGVGAPVVEMLRAARLGCELAAVTITSGEKEHQTGQLWNVPKTDLMAGVKLLLEKGELKIARRMRETGALLRELVDVQVTARIGGGLRSGAVGGGQHVDLVIALALAVWRAKPRRTNGFGNSPLF
jgi:hypothetical protein